MPRLRQPPAARRPGTAKSPQGRLIEVYFSVIQRKLLTPDDFEDLDELAAQILAWKSITTPPPGHSAGSFTRTDLNRLLTRIRQHDRHVPHPLAA
jgi:hypothetical protein